MTRPKTFARGGVEPLDYQSITAHLPIKNAPIPATAVIPLLQHAGAPALAVVGVGDEVKEGMLIARADGFLSAHIHSPIPGRVSAVSELTLPDGRTCRAITIECAGEFDRSGKILNRQAWDDVDGATLNGLIAEMGLVGLGGAGFPSHVKFADQPDHPVATLIINGVEGEPYLTGTYRLMLEKPSEILEGTCIIRKILKAGTALIVVEDTKRDAVEILKEKISEKSLPLDVVTVKSKYPQGNDKLLVEVLMKKTVRPGQTPRAAGAVVTNIATAFAAYEAVVWRKPLIERVITVGGSCVTQPSNLKARIGTKIGELFEECGGFSEAPGKIVWGGPLLGTAVGTAKADLETPLTKDVTGLFAFSRREKNAYADHPCIRCGRCLAACPWGLNPASLVRNIRYERCAAAFQEGLAACEECGCCAYVCPARIPLVHYLRQGKKTSAGSNTADGVRPEGAV